MQSKWKDFLKNKKFAAVFSVILISIVFAVLYDKLPFLYETNDDRYMQDIVSGSITGIPDAHMIHIGYLISLPLSVLYRLFTGIPWYGIFLVMCHVVSLSLILYRILVKTKRISGKITGTCFFLLFMAVLEMRQIVLIQYTSTAALVCATSVFWFLTQDEKMEEKHSLEGRAFFRYHIVTVILIMLSFSIRQKAALMLLPIAGMMFLAQMIAERKRWTSVGHGECPSPGGGHDGLQSRSYFIQYFRLIFGILAGVLVSFAVNKIGYGSESWKDFMQYNNFREQTVDYNGFPPYESYEAMYQDMGINKQEYAAIKNHYMLLFSGLDAGKMKQIEVEAGDYGGIGSSRERIVSAVKAMFIRVIKGEDYPTNRVVILCYAILVFLIILHRKWSVIPQLLCLLTGRSVCWIYLLYQGRVVARIQEPLYIAEILVLLAIALANGLFNRKHERKAFQKKVDDFVLGSMGVATFLVLLYLFIAGRYYPLSNYHKGYDTYAQGLQVFNEYCEEHPENIYLVDNNSVTYFTERVLGDTNSMYYNYVIMGGWMVNSPLINDKLVKMGIHDWDEAIVSSNNIYFVFQDNEAFPQDYLWNYLSSKYTYEKELVDRFEASEVSAFLIYRINTLN